MADMMAVTDFGELGSNRGDDPPNGLTSRVLDVTVIAMDPSVRDSDGRIIRTTVPVTTDRLEPGPRNHRLFVVDFDTTRQAGNPPAILTEPALAYDGWSWVDRFSEAPDEELETSPDFRAQNVWAIACNVLERFERALGRRLPWAFGGHHLHLVPSAFEEPNAYYAPEQRAVLFGYVPRATQPPVYTALARDVIAHEVTHAILDGLRHRLAEPGLPDQAAFHEGFADIVALLSILSAKEVVADALGPMDQEGRIPADRVTAAALKQNVALAVARQLGSTLSGGRADALRRSATLNPDPDLLDQPRYQEAHNRGEILVAAVVQAFVGMWTNRLTPIVYAGGVDRARAAEEGAKAADHLLTMAIRAIDYTPPVELEFADYIDALVVADTIVAPDDRYDYRTALLSAFKDFGIEPPRWTIVDIDALPQRPRYDKLNVDALRVDREEVFRFIWQNAPIFEIDLDYFLLVERVRHATRVGPDGLVVTEILADYIQMGSLPLGELVKRQDVHLTVDLSDVDPSTEVQFFGGGVFVFDQFAKARFHQSKPISDTERQSRRLDYVIAHGFADTKKRFGFSYGERRGQRFSALHASSTRSEEAW